MSKNTNPFLFSDDNKRYHTLSFHNRSNGISVQKAVLDIGVSCPNIDGKRSVGGCIFCDGGSGYFTKPMISLEQQLKLEIQRIHAKNPNAKIVAYFQAHTNTYAPVDVLKAYYEKVLCFKEIVGISVATRADCLEGDVLDYLNELGKRTYLTVELGLQTIHDKTAEYINRAHSFHEFCEGYNALKANGIRVCVHLINGLPTESKEMMLETARVVAKMCPDALKIHLLHVISGTKLAELYVSNEYLPLSLAQYVDIVVSQLEMIAPQTIIERITGDADKSKLVAPSWSSDKIRVLGSIDKLLYERNTWQGKLFNN